MTQRKLYFVWQHVQPVKGFPGAPVGNDAAAYDDGYRMYFIQLADKPCAKWLGAAINGAGANPQSHWGIAGGT